MGRWSQEAFVRAMREGVGRDGEHLYPAFPYDHFTFITDEDLVALYAYVMTRDPVRARPPENELVFPLNFRPLLAAWKLLYFRPARFAPDKAYDAQWNRGAYLVTGLAHCGACHTPRNRLGAEKTDRPFAGGEAEGWHAPALDSAAPAPVQWTADNLYRYMRNGMAPGHDAAGGPMATVIANLATAPEEEVRAIAAYIASWTQATADRRDVAEAAAAGTADETGNASHATGHAVYLTACAQCHDTPRDAFFSGALDLRRSTALRIATPANVARIVVAGIVPTDGQPGPWMPPFGASLTDDQLTALIDYLRTGIAGQPAWKDVAGEVRRAHEATAAAASRGAPSSKDRPS
jgi:mono/diheme cytochrome c family protein